MTFQAHKILSGKEIHSVFPCNLSHIAGLSTGLQNGYVAASDALLINRTVVY